MSQNAIDLQHMRYACEVAARARGFAEPNPTVGCVIAIGDQIIAEGWTQSYGSAHAEVHAISRITPVDQSRLQEATLYVTLEPCCHHGKTPPCTDAILATPIRRVVVAMEDPFPQVAGGGLARLRQHGIDVTVGIEEPLARSTVAPYLKLQQTGRPWIVAKWAMTLDGKIATRTGDSKWISSATSREVVHALRGRMDAIVVGIGTALADDPLLTARPKGPRTATRVVVDSKARLPLTSQLMETIENAPVIVAVGPDAERHKIEELSAKGAEVLALPGSTHGERIDELLVELGTRRMTNILVEGGAGLLGGLNDGNHIDEVHVFVAPKVAGGKGATGPVGGEGVGMIGDSSLFTEIKWQQLEHDLYLNARLAR